MPKGNQLQLLVCSGNLGNAPPDDESIASWIPENGRCSDALKYPAKYPVRDQFSTFEEYTEIDQFDIIVIGMQEATFDAPLRTHSGSGEFFPPENPHQRPETARQVPPPAAKKGIVNQLFKKVSELSTYATSRDYTKSSNVRSSLTNNSMNRSPEDIAKNGTAILHDALERRLPSYARAVSYQRGQMRLEVFVLESQESLQVEVLHTKAQNTGRAGLANKGGIVTELLVNGKTRLAFLTAHLEAHEGYSKYQMRCSSLADILNGTREKVHDVSLTSHHCFVLGDLNFRTELPGADNMDEHDHKEKVRWLVNKKNWDALNQADELHRALRCKDCLVGFQTLFCNFPPTFKLDRKQGFHYIDKRRPSYTDRILWKSGHELETSVRPLLYEPIGDFTSSDHKPVRAAFSITLNEKMAHRAKMARRRSALQLTGFSSQTKQDAIIPKDKRLHIFLSDIHCFLAETESSNSKNIMPNPYVCLVSNPKEIFKASKTRWDVWKRILSFGMMASKEEKEAAANQTSMSSWPQSSVQKATYQPHWDGEEFNAEVKAYRPDGSPLDLTGSMIYFTVMDNKQSGNDEVLGTFCYNLDNLLRTYKPPSPKHPESTRGVGSSRQRRGSIMGKIFQRQDDAPTPTEGLAPPSSSARPASRQQRRGSFMNMMFRRQEEAPAEEDPVMNFPIDAPLIRNGQETGRIRFTMEAWWMDESTAKAMGSGGRNSLDAAGMFFGSGVTPMFSTRHTDRNKDDQHSLRQSVGRKPRGQRTASVEGTELDDYDAVLSAQSPTGKRQQLQIQSPLPNPNIKKQKKLPSKFADGTTPPPPPTRSGTPPQSKSQSVAAEHQPHNSAGPRQSRNQQRKTTPQLQQQQGGGPAPSAQVHGVASLPQRSGPPHGPPRPQSQRGRTVQNPCSDLPPEQHRNKIELPVGKQAHPPRDARHRHAEAKSR